MPRACAEASARLINTLRRQFRGVVTILGEPQMIRDREFKGPQLWLIDVDSPLISEDWPEVEIVVERDAVWFKKAVPL